ncbi:MAG: oligosaccharide flippase family protein [Candidatus Thermoplasmatota archaeon]
MAAGVSAVVLERDRNFLRGFLATGASQIVLQAQNLGLLVLFLRIAGPEAYGNWNLLILTTTVIALVATLNLQMAVVRFAAGETSKALAGARVRRLLQTVIVLALGGTVLTMLLADLAARVSGEGGFAFVLRIGAPLVLLQAIIVTANASLLAAHKATLLSIVGSGLTLLELGAAGAVLWLGGSLVWVVLAYMAAKAFSATILLWLVWRAFPGDGVGDVGWKDTVRYSLPALPATVAIWMLNSGDRYLISHFQGMSDVGRYAAVNGIANLLLLVPVPLSITLFPRVMHLWETGDRAKASRYLTHAMSYLLITLAPIAVGLVLVGDQVMAPLATPTVVVASRAVLPWAIVSAVLWSPLTPYLTVLRVTDRTRLIGAVWIAAAVGVVLLGLVLVPILGIVGAAIARTFAFVLVTIAVVAASRRDISIPVPWGTLGRVLIATGLLSLVVWALLPVTGWPRLVLIAVAGGATYAMSLLLLERAVPPPERLLTRFMHPGFWTATGAE